MTDNHLKKKISDLRQSIFSDDVSEDEKQIDSSITHVQDEKPTGTSTNFFQDIQSINNRLEKLESSFYGYAYDTTKVLTSFHQNIKKLNILYTYSTDELLENEIFIQIINWALNNNIDLVWAVKSKIKSENIFPKFLNKSINFASWSSDEKIFKVLQKGLSDSQGIDSDVDSNLYIE